MFPYMLHLVALGVNSGGSHVPADLMHDDVRRPKGSMVVVVTLKFKMAAGSTKSGGGGGGNSKNTRSMIYLKAQTNPPSHYFTAQPHQNARQHYVI